MVDLVYVQIKSGSEVLRGNVSTVTAYKTDVVNFLMIWIAVKELICLLLLIGNIMSYRQYIAVRHRVISVIIGRVLKAR
ncbi:Protein of unknown function [Pyronema omphalodes CBS 100304]|uniref:Uncharacterized protein n=1 Tax=Pyronema omphalodes (strain CBS 100304) TaxID=1076935 RepID=U4L2X7_PYROM|nr:Protein of unknown function [Pyronema omphalodes CBS 100304]